MIKLVLDSLQIIPSHAVWISRRQEDVDHILSPRQGRVRGLSSSKTISARHVTITGTSTSRKSYVVSDLDQFLSFPLDLSANVIRYSLGTRLVKFVHDHPVRGYIVADTKNDLFLLESHDGESGCFVVSNLNEQHILNHVLKQSLEQCV